MPTIAELRKSAPELAGMDDARVVRYLHNTHYSNLSQEDIASRLGIKLPEAVVPEAPRSWGGVAQDVGISALKGAIGVPEAAVGLADMATGGYAGQLAEQAGFRPKEAKAMLDAGYSSQQQAAFQKVQAAQGLGDTFIAAVQNPSVVGHSVIESLPLMGAGGVLARGGLALAPKLGAVAAGAVGEGAVGAGSAAEQIRQQSAGGLLTAEQTALAGATGVLTTGFSMLGGKIAQKLGIADVDTMLAGAVANPAVAKGVVRSALEGALSEGILEELPQSVAEQVLQNQALGQPLDAGVNQAAVLGLLSGGTMGAGANMLSSFGAKPEQASGLPNPDAAPPAAPALQLGNKPDPLISFPDGTVARQSEADTYVAGLPPDQQPAARAKMMGLAPQPAKPAGALTRAANAASVGLPGVTAVQDIQHAQASEADQAAYDQATAAQEQEATQQAAEQDTATQPITTGKLAEATMSEEDKRAVLFSNQAVADGGHQYTGTQDGDVLNGMGAPFKTKMAALRRAKMEGKDWTIATVFDGFVARRGDANADATTTSSLDQSAAAGTSDQPAGSGSAAVGAVPTASGDAGNTGVPAGLTEPGNAVVDGGGSSAAVAEVPDVLIPTSDTPPTNSANAATENVAQQPVTQPAQPGTTGEGAGDSQPTQVAVTNSQPQGSTNGPTPTQAVQAEEKGPQAPAAAKPVATKQGVKAKIEQARQARTDYFTPGNIVQGYGGYDEVLSYTPPGANGEGWSVKVQGVKKVGDQWVRTGKPQDARTHSTQPEAQSLKSGPVDRLGHQAAEQVQYSEPRGDGKPFPNAMDRGTTPKSESESMIQNVLKADAESAAKVTAAMEQAKKQQGNVVVRDGKVYRLNLRPLHENGRQTPTDGQVHASYPGTGLVLVLEDGIRMDAPAAQTRINQAKADGFEVEGSTAPEATTTPEPQSVPAKIEPAQPSQQESAKEVSAEPPAEPAKPSAPPVAKPAENIADFGEKIGGAKKDLWATYEKRLGEVSDADLAAQPLSKSWPQPDYQELLDGGADPWTVGFVRAARDSIPRKPNDARKAKVWAGQVQVLRDFAVKLLNGEVTQNQIRVQIGKLGGITRSMDGMFDRIRLYMLVGHSQSLEGVRISRGEYGLKDGVTYNPNKVIWTVEKDQKATSFSNWPRELGAGDTKEAAIADFQSKYATTVIQPVASKEATFDIYSMTAATGPKGFWVGKKIGRNYVDLAGPFTTVKEAREYKANNNAELVSKLEKSKEIPHSRRDTNEPRVGEDMRNGEDVTPTLFGETFGFKGVEFGNYVEQTKRQKDLNEAFDALMDMAAILELPPKALSLNGSLGIAFGARGNGGVEPAAAHYEPDFVVINLTKKEGAGSIGHEWWHGLDNYFSKQRSKDLEFMTQALDVSLASRDATYHHTGAVRKEMVDAFGAVMKSIRMTALKARSSKLDAKRSKEYWTTSPEMTARAFESYLISKLHDQNASNDYLANIVGEKTWKAAESLGFELDDSYPYPTAGEIPTIRAGFESFFKTVQTKETKQGVAMFSRNSHDNSPEQHALQAISQNDELFALPKSDKDTVEGIAADTDPSIKVTQTKFPGLVKTYTLTMPDGGKAKMMVRAINPYGPQAYGMVASEDGETNKPITDRPGFNADSVPADMESVYIDVSTLKGGGYGAKVYNIAATYAHNTGRIMIGDPAGLSDIAMRRRTESMLSSALKFGTTQHLAPHPRQIDGAYGIGVPPLRWTYGDDLGNIKSLIETSLSSLKNAGANLLTFDLQTGIFRDSKGRIVDDGAIRSVVKRGRRPESGAGITTHKRSAVLSSLVREEGAESSAGRQGAGILAELVAIGRQFPAPSKGIFYARGDDGLSQSQPATTGLPVSQVQSIVNTVAARWANAPEIIVATSMSDTAIPQKVRDYDQTQKSQGASGEPEGFVYGGKVYLLADQLSNPGDVVQVLLHESLGHMGMRGVFGDSLKPILKQIAAMRAGDVRAKAKQYGIDMNTEAGRLEAAEEVLAEMAQTRPELGYVKRAIAAIRNWLRSHGFAKLAMTDADILQGIILPARRHVEAGQGKAVPEIGGAQFSRSLGDTLNAAVNERKTNIVGETSRKYTPAQLAAFKAVGFQVDLPSMKERAQALWQDAGKKLAQGLVDQFAPIKDVSKEAYGLLRLAKGASGAFEVFMHGGQLKLEDGVYNFDDAKRGGVVDRLLKPLQTEHHDFFRWVAANRAERLKSEGKENLFSDSDIAAIKTLADGTSNFDYTLQNGARKGQVTRERAAIYRDSLVTFNGFQNNVLDMAEQSGLIDGEARKLWEHEFYVPFYRIEDDGSVAGAHIKNGAVRQQAFKSLTGRVNKLNADLMDNTLMNWAHLLDAAAKNRAAKATIEAIEKMGAAIPLEGSAGKGSVWFRENGQKRWALVDDPHLLTAVSALEYAGMRNPAMNAMGAMKRVLTIGVTASPFFKVRNLIRDSVQAIGTGNLPYNPAKNLAHGSAIVESGKAFKNLGKAIANTITLGATDFKIDNTQSDAYFRLLAGGGTIHFGTMMEGSESKRVQALVESGVDDSTILGDEHKVKAFYRKFIEPGITAYNELGNRGEAINRAALYDQLVKQGVSHAEASLQARDLMDFSMQGSFTTIRFLTQVVPFMNARIQGLYKLGKSAKEDPARFSAVLGATALFSLALLAAYGDDDDWKKREDWDRNNYWWFKFGGTAFRIPKPFEIGAIATLAERGFELAFDKEMTSTRFRGQVLTLLGDNLSMNPIPQMVKPILDVYANKDSFSGRPIETMGMDRLQPEYRFTDRTSMTARGLSTAANEVTNLAGIDSPSPVQIDSMLRGYFGWLGSFVVGAGDVLARPATNQAKHAAPDYWKTATGSIVSDVRDAPSRYVSQMYTQAKEIEQAYGTWRSLQKEGKTQEAAEFRKDNADKLSKYRQIEHIKKLESSANQRIRLIERSSMDGDKKRELIRGIQEQKDRAARVIQ